MTDWMSMAPPALFVLLLLLCAADTWTTHEVLRMGGRELNPIVRWLIEHLGQSVALLVPRGALLGVVAWAVFASGEDALTLLPWLIAANVVYVVVVWRNVRNYFDWRERE